jgi:stage III sporulation protein AC
VDKNVNIELILKVAGIGIIVTVAYQILIKSGRDEQAMLVSVAGIIITIFMLVNGIGGLFETIRNVFGL